MPEIKYEHPSDNELSEYLQESVRGSSFCLAAATPDGLERMFGPNEREAVRTFLSIMGLDFLESSIRMIFQSLQRLNGLSRADPFWLNTNCRPTIPKLGLYCDRLLKQNPDDTTALWTLAALGVWYPQNDFGLPHWKRLLATGAIAIDTLICASLTAQLNGTPTAEELGTFIKDVDQQAAAMPILRRLSQTGGKVLPDWSQAVMSFANNVP